MELYEFKLRDTTGETTATRYTSGIEDYVLGINTYLAVPIQRGEISFEFADNKLTIILPAGLWPASEFLLINPYGVVEVTLYNALENIMFSGTIAGCTFNTEKGTAKLTVTSIQEVFNSQVPVKVYSSSCPFELYGGNCGVLSSNYVLTIDYEETNIVDDQVTNSNFSSKSDGYFTGGWVETKYERSAIIEHVGNVITTMYPLIEDTGGDLTLLVYPGCDKSIDSCKDKYKNINRFGGFPWVPDSNPVTEEF